MARQFNLIPPICEQAEYHMFQREKVEVQLPELFHKIGMTVGGSSPAPQSTVVPKPSDAEARCHGPWGSWEQQCHPPVLSPQALEP